MALRFVVKPLSKGAKGCEWLFYMYLDEGWVSATSERFATQELTEQAARAIIEQARQGSLTFQLNRAKDRAVYCARIMDQQTDSFLAQTGFHDTPEDVNAMLRRLLKMSEGAGGDEPVIVS